MLPSHFSVADFGVFAVALVLGLIVVLLFMFDFVSILVNKGPCLLRLQITKGDRLASYTEIIGRDQRRVGIL